MINIILALFTLIPVIIFLWLFLNGYSPKDKFLKTSPNSEVKYETTDKMNNKHRNRKAEKRTEEIEDKREREKRTMKKKRKWN